MYNENQWKFCQIMSALSADKAVDRGIISREKADELAVLTVAFGNDAKLRHWLGLDKRLQPQRVAMLIGRLYDEGFFFSVPKGTTGTKLELARFLAEDGALALSLGSMVTALSKKMPRYLGR